MTGRHTVIAVMRLAYSRSAKYDEREQTSRPTQQMEGIITVVNIGGMNDVQREAQRVEQGCATCNPSSSFPRASPLTVPGRRNRRDKCPFGIVPIASVAEAASIPRRVGVQSLPKESRADKESQSIEAS